MNPIASPDIALPLEKVHKMHLCVIQHLQTVCHPGTAWNNWCRAQQEGCDLGRLVVHVDVCHSSISSCPSSGWPYKVGPELVCRWLCLCHYANKIEGVVCHWTRAWLWILPWDYCCGRRPSWIPFAFWQSLLSGQWFLDSFIGDHEGTVDYMKLKVQGWIHCIKRLTKAAESQPQAPQMALTKSLQFEWAYLQRVVPNCSEAFALLCKTINKIFWPTVFSRSISEH